MKKNLYFTLLILCTSFTFALAQPLPDAAKPLRVTTENYVWGFGAQHEDHTYDANQYLVATSVRQWSPDSNAFFPLKRITYTNNTNGFPLTAITESFNPSNATWSPVIQENRTYDTQNNLLTYTQKYHNGSGWGNVNRRHTFTYTTTGQLVSGLYETLVSNTLVKEKEITNTYNNQQQKAVQLTQFYNNGAFQSAEEYTNTYDNAGRMATEEFRVKQNDNIWYPQHRWVFEYSDVVSNHILAKKVYGWFENTQTWEYLYTWEYLRPSPGEEIIQLASSSGQHAQYKYTYMHNAEDQLTLYRYEIWNDSLQALKTVNEGNLFYRPDGSYDQEKYYFNSDINGTSTQLSPSIFKYYIYDPALTPSNENSSDVAIQIFPNPAQEWIYVSLPPSEAPTLVELFQSNGQILDHQMAYSTIAHFNIALLPAGNYYVRVRRNDQTRTFPVIKK